MTSERVPRHRPGAARDRTTEGGRPMDRETAEGALRGDLSALPDGLAQVLRAAQAPGRPHELAGEDAAVAAFRAAGHAPGDARIRRRSTILTRLLSLKVAAAAFATTATIGGVALAAGTGTFSAAPPASSPVSDLASAGREAGQEAKREAAGQKATGPETAGLGTASATPGPSATATPQRLAQLCTEFTGQDEQERDRALDAGYYGELVDRAGERDEVGRFCGDLRRDGTPDATRSAAPRTSDPAGHGPGGGRPSSDRPSEGHPRDGDPRTGDSRNGRDTLGFAARNGQDTTGFAARNGRIPAGFAARNGHRTPSAGDGVRTDRGSRER
ncbi:hypothetical protein [Actinoplanes rectilineatus]|uniref:hypothetical protein n=1 Tax=Actinoplanes rectilineatus TaxID=113571 RepID=UPI000B167FE2|nr:hypothetical protein [Actinoplanes rectilineatus]